MGRAAVLLLVVGCVPAWTDADANGDRSAAAMLDHIRNEDAGPIVRAFARAGRCALEGNLARHDAATVDGQALCVSRGP